MPSPHVPDQAPGAFAGFIQGAAHRGLKKVQDVDAQKNAKASSSGKFSIFSRHYSGHDKGSNQGQADKHHQSKASEGSASDSATLASGSVPTTLASEGKSVPASSAGSNTTRVGGSSGDLLPSPALPTKTLEELEDAFRKMYVRSEVENYRNIIPPRNPVPKVPVAANAGRRSGSGRNIPPIEFVLEQELQQGNGMFKLVRATCVTEKNSAGYGLQNDTIWALKISNVDKGADSKRNRKCMLEQHRRELEAYKRMSDNYDDWKKVGFCFLMNMHGSLVKSNGEICMVFKLMYADLRTFLDGGHVKQADHPRLMSQMAVGIATLHSLGIIHRDIKPENILIDYQANVRITDFGVAHMSSSPVPYIAGDRRVSTFIGTLQFMAPEVTGRQYYGVEVDYFSLGCVFWEMLMVGFCTESLFGSRSERSAKEWSKIHSQNDYSNAKYLGVVDLLPIKSTFELLVGLLHPDPDYRYGIKEMLRAPFFTSMARVSAFSPDVFQETLSSPRRYSIRDVPDNGRRPELCFSWNYGRSDEKQTWINPKSGFNPKKI